MTGAYLMIPSFRGSLRLHALNKHGKADRTFCRIQAQIGFLWVFPFVVESKRRNQQVE
jgi:hypothetical protein